MPNFYETFEYKNYYLSIKTKYENKSDNRSLFHSVNGNTISFIGGKITGIFAMEEILKKILIDL